MTKPKKDKFYLVQEDILPEAIKKTIKVKEILKLGEVKTINEAVEKMDLSRSAYYKYKDFIKPFYEGGEDKVYSLHLSLKDRVGILSDVLDVIAKEKISILTVVQNMAVDGIAKSTILIKLTQSMLKKVDKIISKIGKVEGIADIRISGSN